MNELSDLIILRGMQHHWIVRVDHVVPYATMLDALEPALRTRLPMRILAGPHQGKIAYAPQCERVAKALADKGFGIERGVAQRALQAPN